MAENQQLQNWFFNKETDPEKNPIAHFIVRTEESETLCLSMPPSPCTDHIASCGQVGYEYGQPETVFCQTLEEAMAQGAMPCPLCYPVSDSPTENGLEAGVLYEENYTEDCPKCGGLLNVRYRVINGGACDTSEWVKTCPGWTNDEPCGYHQEITGPNTSDFAY
jgi:hypothetical protein